MGRANLHAQAAGGRNWEAWSADPYRKTKLFPGQACTVLTQIELQFPECAFHSVKPQVAIDSC